MKKLNKNVTKTQFTKIIYSFLTCKQTTSNKKTHLGFPADYLSQLQKTANSNYTNVYPIKINQLADIFLHEKNASEEGKSKYSSVRRS